MNTANNVVAVVLTRNRKELLARCLQSIKSQENASCDIVLVDNASEDGTDEMIKDCYSNDSFHYFNTGSNLGSA